MPKTQLKINTRNLYKSDGFAVKELLKISGLLFQAQQQAEKDVPAAPTLDLTSKQASLRQCRSLALEITEKGAELHELLGNELNLRVQFPDKGYSQDNRVAAI